MKCFFAALFFVSFFSVQVYPECETFAVPTVVPVCNPANIVKHMTTIKQIEKRNALLRAGIYVCAFAGASYLGYKFFFPKMVSLVSPEDKTAEFSPEERAAMRAVVEKALATSKDSFLSFAWLKRASLGVRDFVVQSGIVTGLYGVGDHIKKRLFYDTSAKSFSDRSTEIMRIQQDLANYALYLEAPGYSEQCRIDLQDVIKIRLYELCAHVERVLAYMQVQTEEIEVGCKLACDVPRSYLFSITNTFLAMVWELMNRSDKKASDIARGMVLSLSLFDRDYTQALDRFDAAYAKVLES